MRLNSRAFLETPANEPPRLKPEWLDGETAGIIALTGGPGGPLDARDCRRAKPSGGRSPRCTARAVWRPALCRIAAPWHAGRAARRAGLDRSCLRQRQCRWSPPTSRILRRREDYEAHDALICIAEGRLLAETDRRQLTPEHRFKSRAEMVERFRRSAGSARDDRGDRAALRIPSAHASTRSFRAFRSAITAARSTRRASCASAPRRGLSAASHPPAWRRATPSMNTASGSTSSSASSRG